MSWLGSAVVIGPRSVSRSASARGIVLLMRGPVGVTPFDGPDGAESPRLFRAITEIRYVTPAVPPRTQLRAPSVEQVAGPGLAMAVSPVTPVRSAGALQCTVIDATPATAVTGPGGSVGAPMTKLRDWTGATAYLPLPA